MAWLLRFDGVYQTLEEVMLERTRPKTELNTSEYKMGFKALLIGKSTIAEIA